MNRSAPIWNCIKRDGAKEFNCYIVEKGERLDDTWLFNHNIITLRSLDSQGNRVKLLYRGHVRGRTNLVVMYYARWETFLATWSASQSKSRLLKT